MKKHPEFEWLTIYEDGRIQSRNKFLKPRLQKNGYLNVVVQSVKHSVLKTKSVHRLVAETFLPNPENKNEVHHIDDNKLNNHVSNLQWVTKEEHDKIHNRERKIFTHQRMKGNKHALGKGKLTKDDIQQIKELFPFKTNAEIARQFNVSRTYIGLIRNNKINV